MLNTNKVIAKMNCSNEIMKFSNEILEMGLNRRQIRRIARESKGVNTFSPNFTSEYSIRTWDWIANTGFDFGYVVRRCLYVYNESKKA